MPFFCYNKKDYCDDPGDCGNCDVFVFGEGGKVVPSNADRIRAMSDAELAEFLESTHSNMAIKLGGEYIVRAKEYIGIWLQLPAEVDNG